MIPLRETNLRKGLEPFYTMPFPNAEILLFRSKLRVSKYDSPDAICEGEGWLKVKWRPIPSVSFRLDCEDISHITPSHIPIGPAKLESIDGQNFNLSVFIKNFQLYRMEGRNNAAAKICGDLAHPVTIPQITLVCNEVKFHLINFIGCSSEILDLDYNDWQIKIKEVDNASQIYDQLRRDGGYSITHTGLLRFKGEFFRFEEVANQLDALYYFCAFLSGRWCGPVLSVGFTNGTKIWEQWDVVTEEVYAILDELDKTGKQDKKIVFGAPDRLRLTSRISGWEWTDSVTINEANNVFQGFMEKWQEPSWRNSLKTSVFLYVEANQGSGGTEGATILAQSALELLAAQNMIHRNPSADLRIRQLLKDKKIPVEIPPYMKDLTNFFDNIPSDNKYRDGPKVITYIRNKITHPDGSNGKNLQNIEDKIKLQTLWLGIWYLEMVLLSTFGYNGNYANRLWRFKDESFERGSGFLQQVPWRNTFETS